MPAVAFERPRRPIEDMNKRRQQEACIEHTVKHNEEIFKTTQRALWEQKTDKKVHQSLREQSVQAIKARRHAELTTRRHRLAELLNAEAAQYHKDLRKFGETVEERKHRLSTRAKALYERREQERRAFVAECYRRQKRSACDDVRARDSQALLNLVTGERESQIAMKQELKKIHAEQEQRYVEEWKARLDKAQEDETSKIGGIKSRALEVKAVLDEQVATLQKRKDAFRQRRIKEDTDELDSLARAMNAERVAAQQQRKEACERRIEVQTFNKAKQEQNAMAAAQEKKQDLTLLNYAIKCESLANQRDESRMAEEKEMAQRYKSYLDGFQKRQELDDARVNAQRLAIENRIWEKKNEEQRKQAEARAYLMAQVHNGRQEQLANIERSRQNEKNERMEEIRTMRQQQEGLDRSDADKAAQRSAAYKAHMLDIQNQISMSSKRRAAEKQAEWIEAKLQLKVKAVTTSIAKNGCDCAG